MSQIPDDVICSLLTRAVSMELRDFGQPLGPMCVQWQGLPDHPCELIKRGCKVVHSTKGFANLREAEIRNMLRRPLSQKYVDSESERARNYN